MVTTTLPDLPGQPYRVLGVVIGIAEVLPPRQGAEPVRHQMEAQAEAIGADAVIDVHLQMVPVAGAGPRVGGLAVALSGTAVKLI
jgi:hypothetical protein